MAEDAGGEKTLPASQQKKLRARQEGNVPRSPDLSSGLGLGVALLALTLLAKPTGQAMLELTRYYFGEADRLTLDKIPLSSLAIRGFYDLALCSLPFMLAMLVAGLAINIAQVGIIFTAKPLQLHFERLNIITGFGKFFSLRSVMELVKSILKLVFAGWVVWLAIHSRLPDFIAMMQMDPRSLIPAVGALVTAVWWRLALTLIIIGVFDYAFQRWQYERDLRMTRQEAKEELKELEGDPHIKRRIRQLQRQIAMQRMMAEVPKAEVVITNPTEFAIALRYDVATMNAPIVVAKGQRLMAQRIRDLAVEHDVPIIQKPELARTLYRMVDLNQTIPGPLFQAVAEVLSFVYSIDRRADKIKERNQFMTTMRKAV